MNSLVIACLLAIALADVSNIVSLQSDGDGGFSVVCGGATMTYQDVQPIDIENGNVCLDSGTTGVPMSTTVAASTSPSNPISSPLLEEGYYVESGGSEVRKLESISKEVENAHFYQN
jgi:hypothetical protein